MAVRKPAPKRPMPFGKKPMPTKAGMCPRCGGKMPCRCGMKGK